MKRATSSAAIVAGLLSLVAPGCSQMDMGDDAKVELNLMDAPPAGVTSVVLQIKSVAVHVDDDSAVSSATDDKIDGDAKWHTLAVDQAIDLVKLQGESAATTLGTLVVPMGKITQIRLVLDTTKKSTVAFDEAGSPKTCDLDVSKLPATGIKISHTFKAFASDMNKTTQIWLDYELGTGLEKGTACYALKPVLKLFKVKAGGMDVGM